MVKLALSEAADLPSQPAHWIGPLVALGGMAAKYSRQLTDRQLVVALSVPRRDFAAALVGCGWIITSPAPQLDAPEAVLRALEPNDPVRIVTDGAVVADFFARIDERADPSVRLRRSQWLLSSIRAAAKIASLEDSVRSPRPVVGSLARWAKLDGTWDRRLAAPRGDLAIIGTRKWLEEDLDACLATDEELRSGVPEPLEVGTISDLLVPDGKEAATWFTHIYASSRLADELPLPHQVQAAILDGAGAIKYLTEIEAPVVVCIIDRAVADESAAEIVVQLRNSRGEPVSLREGLGWRAPAGVEALAFTVAL
jgi:hypothetical protein